MFPRPLWAAPWNQKAFDAKSLQDALQALGMAGAAPSKDVVIDAPDTPESAAFVPVQITSRIPGTASISVFVDRNPWPHIARFDFTPEALPFVALRLRVAETSAVRTVVGAGTSHYVAAKNVKVALGGCTEASASDASPVTTKAEPIKIRARVEHGVADLRVLVSHPMENGLRKDASGKIAPEHFIQSLQVRLNGKTVIDAQLGRSVATNPLFAFRIQGAKANDKIAVTWRDNKGFTRTDEVAVIG
jgi:quinoprotein dehydrogenase-associated SoxYZ-like carrier